MGACLYRLFMYVCMYVCMYCLRQCIHSVMYCSYVFMGGCMYYFVLYGLASLCIVGCVPVCPNVLYVACVLYVWLYMFVVCMYVCMYVLYVCWHVCWIG